ncbi:unnamed protein product [Urochloa humidicola]
MFSAVSRLSDELGHEAWFDHYSKQCYEVPPARTHPPIPVRRVFYRIKNAIPPVQPPTIQEVDDALATLANLTVQQDERQMQDPELEAQVTELDSNIAASTIDAPTSPAETQVRPSTPPAAHTSANLTSVAELFTTPEQGLLLQPLSAPRKKGRRLKKPVATVASLHRSKRQACSRLKHMPAEQRANYVLCRRLGYIKDDLSPVEQAIREFIASFRGPMPEYIVAALTAMFNLDDDDLCSATEALIRLGGPEVVDGLPELNDSV